VNGGGGAYLGIGGALAWPENIPTKTWAFYPGPNAVRAKLDAETPAWKQPFWQWIKRFGAWPVSIETLSGMFDFNHAPFYQSFVAVRVERSKRRVVFALHGADGLASIPSRGHHPRTSFASFDLLRGVSGCFRGDRPIGDDESHQGNAATGYRRSR
jgi:hypothetical protein